MTDSGSDLDPYTPLAASVTRIAAAFDRLVDVAEQYRRQQTKMQGDIQRTLARMERRDDSMLAQDGGHGRGAQDQP